VIIALLNAASMKATISTETATSIGGLPVGECLNDLPEQFAIDVLRANVDWTGCLFRKGDRAIDPPVRCECREQWPPCHPSSVPSRHRRLYRLLHVTDSQPGPINV